MNKHEFDIIDKHITDKKNRIALDVGANFGDFSIYYTNKFKNIHAFEPVSSTYANLEKNIKTYNNILVHNVAIGDKMSNVDIVNLKGHSTRNKVQDNNGRTWLDRRIKRRNLSRDLWEIETVEQRTIDSYSFENVDLIKIDTEGYVLPVINGMINTIQRCKPVLYVELHNNTPERDNCFSILEKFSYKKEYVDSLNHIFFM